MVEIRHLERGIPSKRGWSNRVDYVPASVKGLADKKLLKEIRNTIVNDTNSFLAYCKSEKVKSFEVIIPEDAIFSLTGDVRTSAINYWKGTNGCPCDALYYTTKALGVVSKDKDGKEALDELDTVEYRLVIGTKKITDHLKAYTVAKEGKKLVITCNHCYCEGNEESPGGMSPSSNFSKQIIEVL